MKLFSSLCRQVYGGVVWGVGGNMGRSSGGIWGLVGLLEQGSFSSGIVVIVIIEARRV